jgi:hypothetical protein
MSIDESIIQEFLRLKNDYLYHREGQELEFKEQFSFAGLADYFRDFAAFANNRGGYLVFGVQDAPRIPVGLNESSLDQFQRIDPARISGYLLDIFSGDIRWEQAVINQDNKMFGVFRIHEANSKPIIAKKEEGRDQIIRNGEIYYRYGGRTQRIQYAELENIISSRLEQNNQQWQDLVQKIGKAGPSNAAILDTERSLIEKDDAQITVLDEELANKLKYVKTGEFSDKNGEPTLKLVGDVVPVERVEVIKRVKANRLKRYPFSAMELAKEVEERLPDVKRNEIWDAIKENDLKNNPDYSVYNFRNKRQQDQYKESGELPSYVPSIYNQDALDFLISVLGT